jgi:hypothetical protein
VGVEDVEEESGEFTERDCMNMSGGAGEGMAVRGGIICALEGEGGMMDERSKSGDSPFWSEKRAASRSKL